MRDVVALGEKHVGLVLGINVGDPPVVPSDFDGLAYPCDSQRLSGTRRQRQGWENHQTEYQESALMLLGLH